MTTNKSAQHVIISDLERNNFSRSGSLAQAARVLAYSGGDLQRLVNGTQFDWEPVFRSKFDGDNRPGCHPSLTAEARLATLFEPLEEVYWEKAAEFDGQHVYSLVLRSDADRKARPEFLTDRSGDFKSWCLESTIKAQSACGWIGGIDLAQFYREVTGEVVYNELGYFGLGLEPRFVDALSMIPGQFGYGLPQGTIVSDLIARLILTPIDRDLRDLGIPFDRYVDDYHVYGSCPEEVAVRLAAVKHLLALRKIRFNRSKEWVQGPERLKWIKTGTIWGEVPIERYVLDGTEENEPDDTEKFSGSTLGGRIRLDHEQLFHDEFAFGCPCRSEHGLRLNYRAIGRIIPEEALLQIPAIVARMPYATKYLISGYEEGRGVAARRAFESCPERSSLEDDRLQAIEACGGWEANRMATEWLCQSDGICCRAARQGAYAQLYPTGEALEVVSRSLSRFPWIDELSCAIQFSVRVGGREARVFQTSICNNFPLAGLLVDAFLTVDQALA